MGGTVFPYYMSADQVLYTKSNTMTIRDLAE